MQVWGDGDLQDGYRTAQFICKSHIDCEVLAKGVQVGGSFWVQVTADKEHSTIENSKDRKNAPFTMAEREAVRNAINAGSKPAGILSALTIAEQERCKKAGETPAKRVTGGLAGGWATIIPQTYAIRMNIWQYTIQYTTQYDIKYIQYTPQYNSHRLYSPSLQLCQSSPPSKARKKV